MSLFSAQLKVPALRRTCYPMLTLHLSDGDISIFERDGGALQNHISRYSKVEDQRCIHWNRAAQDMLMFATGSAEEGVQLWVAYPRKQQDNVGPGAREDRVTPRRTNAPRPISTMVQDYARAHLPFLDASQKEYSDKERSPISER